MTHYELLASFSIRPGRHQIRSLDVHVKFLISSISIFLVLEMVEMVCVKAEIGIRYSILSIHFRKHHCREVILIHHLIALILATVYPYTHLDLLNSCNLNLYYKYTG